MRNLILAAVGAAAFWIPVAGRVADRSLETAGLAWDRGDYVAALTTYLDIIDSASGDASLETIALQTGEVFQTTELTPDGEAPLFSADGRYLSFETGALPQRTIRLVTPADPRAPVATLRGFRAAFSPDGTQLAYLQVNPTPALTEAAAAIDAGPASQRSQRLADFTARVAAESALVVRDLASGRETTFDSGALRKQAIVFSAAGPVFTASTEGSAAQIYLASTGERPTALTTGEGDKIIVEVSRNGSALAFTVREPGSGRGGGGGGQTVPPTFHVLSLPGARTSTVAGSSPAFSADGSAVAYVTRAANETRLMLAPLDDPAEATVLRTGPERMDVPVFSPDGSRLAFQMMGKEDWEIYLIGRDGRNESRLTREIQHDVLPRFLSNDRLVGMIGEARHRRSQLYDLTNGARTRIFHNNTVRTIAPEYAWVPSPDGLRLLVVAERDGDTVSPARGIYLVDLSRRVTRDELRVRLRASLAAEQALRSRTERLFAPIAADVRRAVARVSVARIFGYEKALFDFDSKHITRPGNKLAGAYLFDTYKSFGYEPEYQWFNGRGALGGQTANVLATLKGTTNPELVYVVSSHYDSVAIGPGADDDSSGTAALLETARIMSGHPQPATIVFASFTGEEAGLLGSREYVRQAVANDLRIVGALNNDMVGWANDHRLDNTIRYSNAGIRDVQHGAAMHFTDLITYDALYYKSTDAAAYYEAYGDIVGGIGSYPVLGNPHYHQSHDLLDTINHRLVAEVAKTTVATLMLLASSPSRLVDLKVDTFANGTARLSWRASPEKGVTGYVVAYGPPGNPEARRMTVTTPSATVPNVAAGTIVAVKAINGKRLEGWDWARVVVGR